LGFVGEVNRVGDASRALAAVPFAPAAVLASSVADFVASEAPRDEESLGRAPAPPADVSVAAEDEVSDPPLDSVSVLSAHAVDWPLATARPSASKTARP
jgi:hypothetical protein